MYMHKNSQITKRKNSNRAIVIKARWKWLRKNVN